MGLGSISLGARLAQTRQFINYRPDDVILNRAPIVADGQGGFVVGTPAALLPQRMRMIPTRNITEQAPVRVSSSGQTITPNWFLVSLPDKDMAVGDTAVVRGHSIEIVYVTDIPDDRIVSECWENLSA